MKLTIMKTASCIVMLSVKRLVIKLAIEPMINLGTWQTVEKGWSCTTLDKKPSAHYENTVALTENGAEILTL